MTTTMEELTAPEPNLSVHWVDRLDNDDALIVECASDFAATLARTLEAAGYEARRIDVALRHLAAASVEYDVRGDVPTILAQDFTNLASTVLRAALARHHLVGRVDTRLVAQLGPRLAAARSTSLGAVYAVADSPPAPPARRSWPHRLFVALVAGLALGVVGLPRLDLPSVGAPAPRPTAVPAPAATAALLAPPPAPHAAAPGERDSSAVPAAVPTIVPPSVPTSVPTLAVQPALTAARPLYVQRFSDPVPGWPNNKQGNAWFADGAYHLFARQPGRFVSVGVPLDAPVVDVSLTAQFTKVNGPPGGGYGFVVRNQGPAAGDPTGQSGDFVVAEIGDQGDVGIWRREGSRWVDILPWTASDVVLTGNQPNTVGLIVRGTTVQLSVNGQAVANAADAGMAANGNVAIFVGGDLNEVALAWLRVESAER